MLKIAVLTVLMFATTAFAGPDEYARDLKRAQADRDYTVKLCKGEAACVKRVNADYQAAVKGLQDWHLKGAQKSFETAAKK